MNKTGGSGFYGILTEILLQMGETGVGWATMLFKKSVYKDAR